MAPLASRRASRRAWLRGLGAAALVAAGVGLPAHARTGGDAAAELPVELPDELRNALPEPRLQGRGELRFLGLPVYDIRLWVPPSFDAAAPERPPLALEIRYRRGLDGRRIAERSLDEMRRGGPIDDATAGRWLDAMRRAFPDVRDGDRITGLHAAGGAARFWVNGRAGAQIDDAAFAQRFFGIWLAPHTSEPDLRAALLGGGARS